MSAKGTTKPEPSRTALSDADIRSSLAFFGAPLQGCEPREVLDLDATLIAALALSRMDPTVFRVLPLVLKRNLGQLDLERLRELACSRELLAEWGMLVDLAGEVLGVPALTAQAKKLSREVEQRERGQYFRSRSYFEGLLAERRTPDVVRRWGYLMNMPLHVFRGLVEKHA
ncbi:hypothetical protein [Vulgatibacter sp.]|uniref:hypothetical protein n=1 Tax=Vulgatibacter sp. TaxID=1971226 RepID=UPI003564A36D